MFYEIVYVRREVLIFCFDLREKIENTSFNIVSIRTNYISGFFFLTSLFKRLFNNRSSVFPCSKVAVIYSIKSNKILRTRVVIVYI